MHRLALIALALAASPWAMACDLKYHPAAAMQFQRTRLTPEMIPEWARRPRHA